MIHSFILKRQPKSYNKWKRNSTKGQNYLNYIRDTFNEFYNSFTPKTGELYGIAYYFHSKATQTDADNISKPIWDSLSEFLYPDDKQVKLRIAGCFDIGNKDFDILDVSGVPGNVIADFVEAIEVEEHVVYIECGSLNDNMYKFNLIKNGN